MATHIPWGHTSASMAAVYFMCRYLSKLYSIESFSAKLKDSKDLTGSLSYGSWPHAIVNPQGGGAEDNGDVAYIPIVMGDTKIPAYTWIHPEDESSAFIMQDVTVMLETPQFNNVCLYTPYSTSIDRLHRKPYSSLDVDFPYGSDKAIDRLKFYLRKGELISYATNSSGKIIEVPTNFWLSDHHNDVLMHNVSTLIHTRDGIFFGRISIVVDDMNALFENRPGGKTSLLTHIEEDKVQDKEGNHINNIKRDRPAIYDERLFFAEVNFSVHHYGYPKTLSEFVKIALDQYERAGHPGGRPSTDWAEERLRPTWRLRNRPGEGG